MPTNPALRECDIRGPCGEQVTAPLFALAGRNFARALATRRFPRMSPGTVVVGGDGRRSTPELRAALVEGLVACGASVFDAPGPLPTPALYWLRDTLRAQGVAIVTASHSPPDWNGLKIMNGPSPPTPKDVAALATEPPAPATRNGNRHVVEHTIDLYIAARIGAFSARGLSGLPVVVDPGCGCQAGVATRAFAELDAQVTPLHDAIDPEFRGRHPDSAVPRHLTALAAKVLETRAAIGVAFDGDGDRLAIVDDRGRFVAAEKVAMLLIEGPLALQPQDVVVLDVKASMQLERAVTRRGGIAVRSRSGHAYIKRVVMGRNAVLGSEVSGHLFFGALNGIDDPLHAALLLTQWLVDGHGPLSERIDALPVFHLSPDLRLKIPAWDIDQLLASLPERFAGAEIERIDGVRIVWPEGWMLARRSITEPVLTLRFEGVDAPSLQAIRQRFVAAYPALRVAVEDAAARF
jgi:phosphomannomutase/phosphoglucomutase